MKSMFALQQFKKCIILFIVGIMSSFLTYLIYIADPVKLILEYNLQMAPHSMLFSIWKKPPLDLYLNIYIFNITNSEEFLHGKEKLKVEQLGPYVYQEFLENDNVTFNDNDTITFIPRRKVVYVPEMSVGDPKKDKVMVPNIAYLGVSSALHNAGFFVNYPFMQLANMMNTKTILNISVYDYLWGYEDSMVSLASKIVPNFITFQKLGLLDRMYDEGENIVTLNLRKDVDMTIEKGRYLSIDKYNGSPGLAQWGYVGTEGNETKKENNNCNTLQGATEGIIFPSNIDKRAIFRVFRKAFCRALPIMYRKETWAKNGLPGYLYTLTDDFADLPDQNPDNACFCRKMKSCLKKGLLDVTPCYYNIPAAVSLPHFLRADPSLLENIEGLNPDEEKHESYVILQQVVGVPIFFHSRLQTNLVMHHTKYNTKIAPFNDMVLPLFWFDMTILTIPTYLLILLKLILQILPIAQTILMYVLGIIGVTTIVLSLMSILWVLNQEQKQEHEASNRSIDSTDLRVPLYNGPYTSINILPTIKKMTSKTDLFS
ncbi:scavenger receptor class B member 1-like isoform X2 [Linepithema humile]|uniref:scavenger receptor class B member 1-like isoform X2 n=1 Tax=Linepithema humile TaxID=83485 RepID=UPI000623B052|nr:PREDICTED: scavenger receptor class B member 1-like [Linepithema humile]XP_012221710.1 PREDICTED: scavenger receptor class B member 1-like [Linepithema humile]XP_012221711.1 PREDICTED: scavenger receptor class B member 1-like [Linepithema humile]